jgi:hypothetical protein
MLSLRFILALALTVQLWPSFFCCASSDDCEAPVDGIACCIASGCCSKPAQPVSCCSNADEDDHAEGQCDERDSKGGDDCQCCAKHRLKSTDPTEAVLSPQDTTVAFVAIVAMAPMYDQLEWFQVVRRVQQRPLHVRPTIQRLAQLSVWRN